MASASLIHWHWTEVSDSKEFCKKINRKNETKGAKMKKLLLAVAVLFLTACSTQKVIHTAQPVKLPNKCGNYALLYGTLKADGEMVTISNKKIKMTPIGMTEARAAEPLPVDAANIGKNAFVKGIYWGEMLYRAEILEVVEVRDIDVQRIENRCKTLNQEFKKVE